MMKILFAIIISITWGWNHEVEFPLVDIFLQWYDDSSPDLSDIFPAGTTEGVSAATVLAQHQTFAAFNKINYQGLETQLKPGQWYESPEEMGFGNDTMLSIRRNWRIPSMKLRDFAVISLSDWHF